LGDLKLFDGLDSGLKLDGVPEVDVVAIDMDGDNILTFI